MDIMKIVNQAINVVLKPKETLKKLKDEKITKESLLIYLGIVALPTLIGIIVGYGVVGFSFGWGIYSISYRLPIGWSVAWGGGVSPADGGGVGVRLPCTQPGAFLFWR